MNLVTQKGSVVWLYGPQGVAVMRPADVTKNKTSAVALERMIDDLFRCWVGDQRKVPAALARPALSGMLRDLGARNGVVLKLTEEP